MKKWIGMICIIVGFPISIVFLLVILNFGWEYFEYGYLEVDVLAKCTFFLLLGLGLMGMGITIMEIKGKPKPSKKEIPDPYMYTKGGHTYIKMGGDYFVGNPMYVYLLFLGLTTFWAVNVIVLEINLYMNGTSLSFLELFMFTMIFCFGISGTYYIQRPRIIVKKDVCICYPRWGKKREICYGEITERKVERDVFFFLNKKIYITYYSCGKEVISLPATMKNVIRFDLNVYVTMDKKKKELSGESYVE